jgi:GNAT superfamily N-acetyltransferase
VEGDWRRLLDLSNCFGMEDEGSLVASVSVTCYGKDLAWIGMVLTLPEHRGKGHASQLMRHAMDFAFDRRMQCIKLDATELGAPVYRKFGFEDECLVERWKASRGPESQLLSCAEINWEFDRTAFGADRRGLVESFDTLASDMEGSFACWRRGKAANQFGPCVSKDPEAAKRLASWGSSQGPVFWDLFPGNSKALEVAHASGFTPSRKLLRMSYMGRDLGQDPSLVYALGGFEWG